MSQTNDATYLRQLADIEAIVGDTVLSIALRYAAKRIEGLHGVLSQVDAVMDVAALEGVRNILAPAYQDGWAQAHMAVREALKS